MKRHIAAVVGLSGVGKSTLLTQVAATVTFQYLQASALIREERQSANSHLTIDQLRSFDLDENQVLLVNAFRRVGNPAGLIVLDAHAAIEQNETLILVRPDVFQAIGINSMVYLTEESAEIARRRLSDTKRQRQIKSAEQINCAQEQVLQHAKDICTALSISISIFRSSDHLAVTHFLQSIREGSVD